MKRHVEIKANSVFAQTFPVRLHLRTDLHLLRKAWHMLMGLIIAFVYMSGMSRTTAVVILGCVLGWVLIMETLRLKNPAFNEKAMRFFSPIMRSCEANKLSGVPHYLASTILAIGLFPRPVAILSILFLACGDPIASLMGILHGHRSIRFANGKSLIGTLAGVLTCMTVGYVFLKSMGYPDASVFAVSLIGGIAGGTAELLPIELDDNFTIPVISGFMLWLAFMAFGLSG